MVHGLRTCICLQPQTCPINHRAFLHETAFCDICYNSQVADGKFHDLPEGKHIFRAKLPRVVLRAGIYHLAVMVSEKNELASHTWNNSKFILVRNPRPELGFYRMNCQFEIEGDRRGSV